MRAGQISHRVEIQENRGTVPNTQGVDAIWVTIKRVWASIEGLGGREYWHAAQAQAENSVVITMRNCGVTIEPTHRIRWLDKKGVEHLYGIENVDDKSRRGIEYILRCKELVS